MRTLINHIIGSNYFIATLVNEQPLPDPSTAPDFTKEDINAAYEQSNKVFDAAWAQDGAFEKTYAAPFGPTPAQVLFTFGVDDQLTHGWDLAEATGQSTDLDAELATTSMKPIEKLVALLGRQP